MRGYCAVLVVLVAQAAWPQPDYRPNREFRSLNTETYHIAIQKNGELDVTLASGEPVFDDAFPMVWIEGDRGPGAMAVDGTWSERFPVRDALGEGNGMALRKKECTWLLRTYPTQPFMAVQVVYENVRKKPVSIRALMPWSVGEPRKGGFRLGPNTPDSVQRASTVGLPHRDSRGEYLGSRNIVVFNPGSGRSLIAGFMTHHASDVAFSMEASRPEKNDVYDRVRFVCVFDPPVTLQPGERLESDVLYLGLAEPDPVIGLERFAFAVRAANNIATSPSYHWLADGEPATSGVDSSLEARPPRPLDLFDAEPYQSWAWTGGPKQSTALVVLKNRSEDATTRPVSVRDWGGSSALHHMYDVDAERYLGVAAGTVSIQLDPGVFRRIAFSPVRSRPHLVMREAALSSGEPADWDGTTLRGTHSGDGADSLLIAVPEPYRPRSAASSAGTVTLGGQGALLTLSLEPSSGETLEWSVSFEVESR